MTFGKDVRKSKYPLAAMEVGAVYAHRAESKEEQKRIRRAAHNRNIRTDMYFSTHVENGVVFITRIR
jgi:hypothetical protein